MRRGFEGHRSSGIRTSEYFEIGELRDVLGDRIARLPLAFLVQHHHRRADNRFGHRVDAHDGVELHRRLAVDVLEAVGLVLHDLSVPRQQRHDACEMLLVDNALHRRIELFERVAGEPNALRAGKNDLAGSRRGLPARPEHGRRAGLRRRGQQNADEDGCGQRKRPGPSV